MSTPESNSEIVLELAEEFLERYRKGQRPPLREYIDRHPELAAEIKEVFPAMAMMENIALADESMEGKTSEVSKTSEVLLEQVGDYRIIREVGRGGMGVVYEAEQVSLGRHVALKVLPQKALLDGKQKRRFQREAKAAAKLHHTNIVPIFAVGEHDGMPYYAMQFIQGLGLDQVMDELKRMQPKSGSPSAGELRVTPKETAAAGVARSLLSGHFESSIAMGSDSGEPAAQAKGEPKHAGEATIADDAPFARAAGSAGRLSDSFTLSSSSITLPGQSGQPASAKGRTYWESVAQIGVQVADALEYAHKQGILHRDIKPSNLLLDTRGTVWVTDFGLAKADDQQNITHTGDILGTLRYMPPEAFDAKTDARSDVYALGLTLYEMLALQPAFDEQDRNKLIKQVMSSEPARLNRLNPAIPRDLVTVVHKAIDRELGHRYATAAELAADLQRFIADEPIQARRLSPRERLWRWCRRNPAVAALTAGLMLVLVFATLVSLNLAFTFDDLAKVESAARAAAVESQQKTEENLKETDRLRKLAQDNLDAQCGLMKELAADRYKLAHQAAKDGKTDDAIRDLHEVVQLYESLMLRASKNELAAYLRGAAEAALEEGQLHAQLAMLGIRTQHGGWLLDADHAWEKAVDYLHDALEIDPEDAKARKQLAEALPTIAESYARMGLWEEAARHYREWLKMPMNPAPPMAFHGIHLAFTAAQADDADLHEKACAALQPVIKDVETLPDGGPALHLAWAWSLRPGSPDPARAVRWAQYGITRTVAGNGWRQFVLGLAHYRAGENEQAVAAAHQALRFPWSAQIMNYPVLAMAHQRRGQTAEAEAWLAKARVEWARFSPLQQSLASPTVLPRARAGSGWMWHDWGTFEVLYREAAALISGSPPIEQAFDELHRGYLWMELNKPDEADALFTRAIKTRPNDIQVRLARSRLFRALAEEKHDGMLDRADADALEVTQMQPKNPHAWIGYSRALRERGRNGEANSALARAAELTPSLHTFFEDGWWVAGPYPTVDMRLSAVAEKEADPSQPTPVSDKATVPWRFVPANDAGQVDLRAIYDADNISVYALNYIYALTDRNATLLVGGDDWVRLWVNGKLVYEVGAGHDFGRLERVPISLRAGRNTLLVKVNNFMGPHFFTARVADNPFDQARTFADLGLWKETAELWPKHKTLPEEPREAYRFAYACLRANDMQGYRDICQRMLDRSSGDNLAFRPYWTARACVLAPKAVADLKKLLATAETADTLRNSHGRFARAAAHFRNGQFDEALRLCDQSGSQSEQVLQWLLRALAYHAQGDLPQTKVWRAKAEEALDGQKGSIEVVRLDQGWAYDDWLTAQILRPELAAHLGEKVEDFEDQAEKARRADVQKLGKDTYDYDLALLLQPDEPRLLLARSRRLAELKRDKDAEADLARYLALKPNDVPFWYQQASHHAGLGDWKLAAACCDKAGPKSTWDGRPVQQASICLLTGDEQEYRRICQEMLRFWEPQLKREGLKELPQNVARALTLADHPADEVEKAFNIFGQRTGGDDQHWVLTQSGALLYRAGKYKEAAVKLERCLEKFPSWPGRVVNYLWLALASHKAGEEKEGQRWLAKADEWFAQYPAGMPQVRGPAPHDAMELHDWLEAHILRREAEKAIRKPALPGS